MELEEMTGNPDFGVDDVWYRIYQKENRVPNNYPVVPRSL